MSELVKYTNADGITNLVRVDLYGEYEVTPVEIEKETAKMYKLKGGYRTNLSKSDVGHNLYNSCYCRPEEADVVIVAHLLRVHRKAEEELKRQQSILANAQRKLYDRGLTV